MPNLTNGTEQGVICNRIFPIPRRKMEKRRSLVLVKQACPWNTHTVLEKNTQVGLFLSLQKVEDYWATEYQMDGPRVAGAADSCAPRGKSWSM